MKSWRTVLNKKGPLQSYVALPAIRDHCHPTQVNVPADKLALYIPNCRHWTEVDA